MVELHRCCVCVNARAKRSVVSSWEDQHKLNIISSGKWFKNKGIIAPKNFLRYLCALSECSNGKVCAGLACIVEVCVCVRERGIKFCAVHQCNQCEWADGCEKCRKQFSYIKRETMLWFGLVCPFCVCGPDEELLALTITKNTQIHASTKVGRKVNTMKCNASFRCYSLFFATSAHYRTFALKSICGGTMPKKASPFCPWAGTNGMETMRVCVCVCAMRNGRCSFASFRLVQIFD